jgi:hypothetical protein
MNLNRKSVYRSVGIMAVLGLGVILAPQKAKAWFGEDIFILAQQLTQQIKMVTHLKAQYDQLKTQAMQFKNIRPSWKMVTQRIEGNSTPNVYGETANWSSAVSGTGDVQDALRKATIPLHANPNFRNEPVGNSPISAAIATANIFDGSSISAMSTIGAARKAQMQVNQSISSLEALALSDKDDDNTQEKSLNIIGAAAVQNLRLQQNQQALLVSIAEQNIATNNMWRNATVQNLNTLTEMQRGLANSPAPGNMAEAIKNY